MLRLVIFTASSLLVSVSSFSFDSARSYHGTPVSPPGTHDDDESSRRRLLGSIVAIASLVGTLPQASFATAADEEEEDTIAVYFGCGCFWHVQHELVQAERRWVGRTTTPTARAGYAGGRTTQSNACYHNAAQIADYGTLGHAEVVQVQIPPRVFPAFVAEYCQLFNEQGYRPDQFQDRGSEYRNLIGIPGGVKGPYAKQMVEASIQAGDKLDFARGNGNDPDRRALVFVMDTQEFPFRVAEQYHQFHDGFNIGENYPSSYNNLARELARDGSLEKSDCPNGLLGLGALGL